MQRYLVALSVLALMLVPSMVHAQFKQGDWELSLAGQGSNDKNFETGAVSIQGNLGYFLTDQFELAIAQSIVWSDGGSSWSGGNIVSADYHFDLGNRWVPFVGANIGYSYGDEDSWIAGPEVGVKFFVNSTTFVKVLASYEFDLNEGFDEGAFLYSLALGFRF